MNARKFYLSLGITCLLAAMVDTSFYRFAWVLFGLAFIVAFDLIKDVEKAKRKERDLTEIRMKQGWLEGWEKSEDARYTFMTKHITNTVDTLLKQLATYVRTGTPDRTCESCNQHCEKDDK